MIVDTDQLVTIKDFAELAKTYPSNVKYYILTGRLNGIQIGRFFFINKSELSKWPPEWKKMGRPTK